MEYKENKNKKKPRFQDINNTQIRDNNLRNSKYNIKPRLCSSKGGKKNYNLGENSVVLVAPRLYSIVTIMNL